MPDNGYSPASPTESRNQGGRERSIISVSRPLPPLGDGGVTHRIVVGPAPGTDLRALDPFVGLAHDVIPATSAFAMHPHRGIDIVTYLWQGGLQHSDSAGNVATVVAGGAERIFTGKGVAHAEYPTGPEDTLGLQLWLALGPQDRDREPAFQLLSPAEVPLVQADGLSVRVVAGSTLGRTSPLRVSTDLLYLDVTLLPGRRLVQSVPPAYAGFVYVLEGQGTFGSPPEAAGAHQRLVLGPGESVVARAESGEKAPPLRFILLAGRPVAGA